MGSRIHSGGSVAATHHVGMLPPPPPPCFPNPQSTPEELEGYRIWYDKYATLYQQYMQYIEMQQQQQQQQQRPPSPPGMEPQFSTLSSDSFHNNNSDTLPQQSSAEFDAHPGPHRENPRAPPREAPRGGRDVPPVPSVDEERKTREEIGRIRKTHEQYTGEVKLAESKTLRLYCPVTPVNYCEQYTRYNPDQYNPKRNQRDAMDALEGRVSTGNTTQPQLTKAQDAEERYRNYAGTFTPGFVHNALYRCHPLEYQEGEHLYRRQRAEEEAKAKNKGKKQWGLWEDPNLPRCREDDELADDPQHDAVARYYGRYRSGPAHVEMHESEMVMNRRRGDPTRQFTSIGASEEEYRNEMSANEVVTEGLIATWREVARREAAINQARGNQQHTPVSDESNHFTCAPRVAGFPPTYHHPTGPVKRNLSWETMPMNPLVGTSGHEPACLVRLQNRADGEHNAFSEDEQEDRRGPRYENNTNTNSHQQGGVRRGYALTSPKSVPPPAAGSRAATAHESTRQHENYNSYLSHDLPSHFDLPADELQPTAPKPPQPPAARIAPKSAPAAPIAAKSYPNNQSDLVSTPRAVNNSPAQPAATTKGAPSNTQSVLPRSNSTMSIADAVRAAFAAKKAESQTPLTMNPTASNASLTAAPPAQATQPANSVSLAASVNPRVQQVLHINPAPSSLAPTASATNPISLRVGGRQLDTLVEPPQPKGFRPLPQKTQVAATPAAPLPPSPPPSPSVSFRNTNTEKDARDRKRERNQIKGARKTSALEELKELYHFYCEPCQKGFQSEGTYKEHLKMHINCPYEGCNFFCKQDWKLNMHITTLHRHPNAPDLADTGKYIAQRKGNFPTGDRIKAKIEELYYRAARGEPLPREKLRWLRRQGVDLKKPLGPQLKNLGKSGPVRSADDGDDMVEDLGESDEEDEEEAARRLARLAEAIVAPVGEASVVAVHHVGITTKEQEEMFDRAGPPPPPPPRRQQDAEQEDSSRPRSASRASENDMPPLPPLTASLHHEDDNEDTAPSPAYQRDAPVARVPSRRELRKTAGAITATMQKTATQVPSYYVCPKCTMKGDHWAVQCRASGAAPAPQPLSFAVTPVSMDASPVEVSARASVVCTEDKDIAEPPATKGFRPLVQGRGEAPVSAEQLQAHRGAFSDAAQAAQRLQAQSKALLKLKPSQQHQSSRPLPTTIPASPRDSPSSNTSASPSQPARRFAPPILAPPPTMSLYDKLVSGERTMDHSLLLQAIRFFVHEEFFGDSEYVHASSKRERE